MAQGHEAVAYDYGKRFIKLGITGAVVVGTLLIFLRGPILTLYNISPISFFYSNRLLLFFSITLWVRVSNMMIFIGILRSGGDTRYCLITETLAVWMVGVPAAFIGASIFHLPIYFVYLLAFLEEVTKFTIVFRRFYSKRWINNLTERVPEQMVEA